MGGPGLTALALLVACATHRVAGLLLPDTTPPELRTAAGETYTLVLEGEAAPVAWLDNCVVEVEGAGLGQRLRVRDWRVLDAGDGTGGFVGILEAYGARVRLADRNTGTTLLVDDEAAIELRPWIGHPVLLLGYVTGGDIVSPVAWRLLAPSAPPEAAAAPAPP